MQNTMEGTGACSGVKSKTKMEFFISCVTEEEIKRNGQKPANSENPSGGKENVRKADVITATKNSALKNSRWTTSSPLSAEENQQKGIWPLMQGV